MAFACDLDRDALEHDSDLSDDEPPPLATISPRDQHDATPSANASLPPLAPLHLSNQSESSRAAVLLPDAVEHKAFVGDRSRSAACEEEAAPSHWKTDLGSQDRTLNDLMSSSTEYQHSLWECVIPSSSSKFLETCHVSFVQIVFWLVNVCFVFMSTTRGVLCNG